MKKAVLPLLIVALTACTGKDKGYDAMGSFNATEVVVSSEVAGAILSFPTKEGEMLDKGQLIAMIDTTQLGLQKQQLMNEIDAMEASRPDISVQLAPLARQLNKQATEKERVKNLYNANAATQKEYDDMVSATNVLQKQLTAQRNTLDKSAAMIDARVAALNSQIEQLNDRILKSTIIAPISGVVLVKYAQAGELSSVGRPMLKMANMDDIHLKAYVTSDQLVNLKLGQEVSIKADFGGDNYREYKGKISWISDKSEFTPKNITTSDERANMVYAMKITVANDGYIKLGMYGEVKF